MPMGSQRLTKGFASVTQERAHFRKHGALLGHRTISSYVDAADRFCAGPLSGTTRECVRPQGCCTGDIVRWDRATGEFGVLSPANYVRTYMKLDLRPHGRKRNAERDYFRNQCNKVT
jgi:hypothetical protein